jgi:hypothetical protein
VNQAKLHNFVEALEDFIGSSNPTDCIQDEDAKPTCADAQNC